MHLFGLILIKQYNQLDYLLNINNFINAMHNNN